MAKDYYQDIVLAPDSLDEEYRVGMMCSDVAPFVLDKLDPGVRAMIEHAAAREAVRANRMIDAIIADRDAKDAMP